MQLAFRTIQLRGICEHKSRAIAQLGPTTAEALADRLADLVAAETLADIRSALDVVSEPDGTLVMTLAPGVVLRFCPNHRKPPKLGDGSVDDSRVTRVQVLAVEDQAK